MQTLNRIRLTLARDNATDAVTFALQLLVSASAGLTVATVAKALFDVISL